MRIDPCRMHILRVLVWQASLVSCADTLAALNRLLLALQIRIALLSLIGEVGAYGTPCFHSADAVSFCQRSLYRRGFLQMAPQ